MNIWFWVSMVLLAYYALALLFSVFIEVELKKSLAKMSNDDFQELANVSVWLCYGSLFWPLSLAKWCIYSAKEKHAKRKPNRDSKEPTDFYDYKNRQRRDMRLAEKKAREGK